ncbi:MAG TPA: hypothetical protein VK196_22270 [Magnetospirillum sp.]|nr:hypothetical protein [Magnetospirillum sp.]
MTPEQYAKVGKAWIATKGGFVLGLAEGELQGVPIPQTPRQWGAWRAYFKERRIPTAFMDAKAKLTAENKLTKNPHCWTVPTEWPHEFDPEATVQGDHEAGNWFMRNWRPPSPVMADAAQRAITAAKFKRWYEQTRRADAPDLPPEEPKGQFIDRDKLLEGYERDMAELAARKAKHVENKP